MNKDKLMWVAGLLEGEGCFTKRGRKTGTIRGNIAILCQMTDKCVLLRLQEYIGAGQIHGPYDNGQKLNGEECKRRWSYVLSGKDAYKVMKKIYPLMLSRRKKKI